MPKWLDDENITGFEKGVLLILLFYIFTLFIPFGINPIADLFLKIVFGALPFVAIIMLGRLAFIMWLHYIRQKFISGIDWVLLEIIPPREVLRSPKAMELF